MNEFDTRQLNIMLKKIDGYEIGIVHLSDLIYDLEALADILEDKDKNWNNIFREFWGDLEQLYAMSLYENEKELNLEKKNMVNEVILNIKKLIKLKLSKLSENEKI